MTSLSLRQLFATLFILFIGLFAAGALQAWSGPPAGVTAPNGNVSAPINVGTTDQVKNAGLSLNALTVFGSQYIQSKLGIGRVSPVVALDVNGTVRIGNGAEVCQAVTEGAIRYNSTSKAVEYCDGTSWKAMITSAPGSQNFTGPGTFAFVVPNYASLTVTINGAGGGGGGGYNCNTGTSIAGAAGGTSTFGSLTAGGGGGGAGGGSVAAGSNGTPGAASGGDTNTTGGGSPGGTAGTPPCSGADWAVGSQGNYNGKIGYSGGAGGAGGKVIKTYSTGALTTGASMNVVLGSGGAAGDTSAGAGNSATATITWQ